MRSLHGEKSLARTSLQGLCTFGIEGSRELHLVAADLRHNGLHARAVWTLAHAGTTMGGPMT